MSEETIIPLSSRLVKCSVKCVLVDGLGIDDVGNAFGAVKPLERSEQDLPRLSLSAA